MYAIEITIIVESAPFVCLLSKECRDFLQENFQTPCVCVFFFFAEDFGLDSCTGVYLVVWKEVVVSMFLLPSFLFLPASFLTAERLLTLALPGG